MKALLIKDFFILKKQLNWILIILLFFSIFTFFQGEGMLLLTLGFVFGTVQLSSLFAYDEMSRWDQFANCLPVKRKQIVLSKYIFALLLSIGILLIIFPIVFLLNSINGIIPLNELTAFFCFIVALSIIVNSISLPFYVKFGFQKGRIAMFGVVFIPIFLIGFMKDKLANLIGQLPSVETFYKIAYVLPFISFLLLIVSYVLAVSFYKKKEF